MSREESIGRLMFDVGIFLFIVYLVINAYPEGLSGTQGFSRFIMNNKTLLISILNPISITFMVTGYTTENNAKLRKAELMKNVLEKFVMMKAQLVDIYTPEELMFISGSAKVIREAPEARVKYILEELKRGYGIVLDSINEAYWSFDLTTIGDLSDRGNSVYSIRTKLNKLANGINNNKISLERAMLGSQFIYNINDITDQKELIPVMNSILDEYIDAFVQKGYREEVREAYSDKGERFKKRTASIKGSTFDLQRIIDEARLETNLENTSE